MNLGDKYLQALSKGIQNVDFLHSLNLKQNRITNLSSERLLKNLSHNLKELNLNSNRISQIGCRILGSYL